MTNEEKLKYIFKVLDKTEVSIRNFSRRTKISRATLYNWKNGERASDYIRVNIAYNAAKRLETKRQESDERQKTNS